MRFDSDYPFKIINGGPAPLRVSLERKIRFGECDPMGVVWHGNYAVYAEEAREALSEACGFPYHVLKECGVALPVKTMFFDYCSPLIYGRVYAVSAVMHWTEAARLNIEYRIFEKANGASGTGGAGGTIDARPRLCTKGFSVQLMTDFSGRLLLDWPPFFQDFAKRWQTGELSDLQTTANASA